ncbi:MAG: hypothetical protein R3B93_27750 [Bacteroidia bacterium]
MSKDLFFLMGVAGIIALPLIWIGIDKWLSQFAFSISARDIIISVSHSHGFCYCFAAQFSGPEGGKTKSC